MCVRDHDDRRVDHRADGDGNTAQRHGVVMRCIATKGMKAESRSAAGRSQPSCLFE